jgi:hypothetical protein
MKTSIVRWASVALAAAVALIATQYAVADYPRIVSSFRMSGVTPPCARGIYTYSSSSVGGIFYEGPGRHSFRIFTAAGSLTATYPMAGAVMLGDADRPPEGYRGYLAVVDEGAHNLKAYTMTGSFHSVIRTLSSDVVAYAAGGYTKDYLYLGTNTGVVFCYTPTWSLANSYSTGVAVADLAAGYGYRHSWGDYLDVGSRQAGDPIRVYQGPAGVMAASFTLPGIRSCGAVRSGQSYWCLRDLGTEIWAYRVEISGLMEVQPSSLGRIKALYK